MTDRGGPQHIPRPSDWTPGNPPPWHGRSAGAAELTRLLTMDRVIDAVRSHEPTELIRMTPDDRPPDEGRRSAVLIPVYEGHEGPTTILTRRAAHMRKHAGEIAFAGGAIDETDESAWHAALREADEEIALDPNLAEPVGELDRFVTGASWSLVTPWVAELAGRPLLTPSPAEVDGILHVPLRELLAPDVYRQELWRWKGEPREIHFFELMGDTIWGATAFMLHQLLELVVDA